MTPKSNKHVVKVCPQRIGAENRGKCHAEPFLDVTLCPMFKLKIRALPGWL